MTQETVLLDVDGVVGDFVGAVIAAANAVTRRLGQDQPDFTIPEKMTWDVFALFPPRLFKPIEEAILRPNFCAGIEVYPGAVEQVNRLRSSMRVKFVTTPWRGHLTWSHERLWWLETHFGAKKEDVHFCWEKTDVHGLTLVEDKPEAAEAWGRYWNKTSILIDRPWNKEAAAVAMSSQGYWIYQKAESLQEAVDDILDFFTGRRR